MKEIYKDPDNPNEPLLLKYHHFSLVMNKKRRLQMWSAVNVDYSEERRDGRSRKEFGTDKWINDPRIPLKSQITDEEFYKPAGKIDRGHIVRREDNAWGDSPDEIEYGNSDTFHWLNCTPQHEAFNQENPRGYNGQKGIWGQFEGYITKQLMNGEKRCCILAGPALLAKDPSADFGLGRIQYPIHFWKVVITAEKSGNGSPELKAHGFIFSQADVVKDFGIEFMPGTFARYQRKLSDITNLTGVEFHQSLHAADTK
jgi:endonuclease G